MDPYFDCVSLLVPFLGANNSTLVQDYSRFGHSLLNNGNAKISTGSNKWYGSSGYMDGDGDYWTMANPEDCVFGLEDFTIECWFCFGELKDQGIFDFRPNTTTGNYPQIYCSATNIIYALNGADRISVAHGLQVGTWAHLALCRASGATKLFLDGQQKGSDYSDGGACLLVGASRPIIGSIGYNPSMYNFKGYLQDFRITKGVARYTGTFTPPAAFLGRLGGTVKDASGNYVARTVRAWPKFPVPAGSRLTTSNATTGAFEFIVPHILHDVQVVAETGDGCDIWLTNRSPVAF